MRSWKERLTHTVLFELGGLVMVTPLASKITGHGIGEIGALAVGLATTAMLWNLIWNRFFDHWVPTRKRTLVQRLTQAFGFEAGLVILTLPAVAWWLGIGLLEAFWLDVGFMLFFLLYALAYNTAFDHVMRHRLAQAGKQ
ncbi:membrane protein [Litchfieldella qijiaojingensis]|uniref:Membrane protein n=1 Tax=Litchfieldella qijiaojingensis TaxID=980347 RepID=A0ABQ2YNR0_9GAMM|nr:PACE efflux transporter [Halomonas qijiaojingensis]GGX88753.1 membrane protein [Halomonas qijiaojingensis]